MRTVTTHEVTVTRQERTEEVTCDRCGLLYDAEGGDGWSYILQGNPDGCVNLRIDRDFCRGCAEILEPQLIELLIPSVSEQRLEADNPDRYWGSYLYEPGN